jgi:hypothetical protein
MNEGTIAKRVLNMKLKEKRVRGQSSRGNAKFGKMLHERKKGSGKEMRRTSAGKTCVQTDGETSL